VWDDSSIDTHTAGAANMTKLIETKTNKRGIKYAFGTDGNTFSVWKLCENYASHCKGGMSYTWRYVQKNMDKDTAQTLFNRRGA
jgi:hypothetical protein